MKNRYISRPWNREELNKLYKSFKDGIDLIKLEKMLERSDKSIIFKLFKLQNVDGSKWRDVYRFYWHQFYDVYRDELVDYQIDYYLKHTKKKKIEFKKYYKNVVSTKPHKKRGRLFKSIIMESKYGKKEDFLAVVANDLIELELIKDASTFYHWIEGYHRPRRHLLPSLSRALNQNQKSLESIFYSN